MSETPSTSATPLLRAHWTSRIGFILAASGSAVGLGNIWKFPYVAGQNGGGAFVIVYLLCVFIIGMPVMMSEILIGRRGRRNPVATMELLGEEEGSSKQWGWLGVLCVAGMTGHYCLIRALDATEAVRIQPFIYLQMVFTTILGWIVFGEAFDPVTLLGMGLIIGAGLYAIWREWLAMQRAGAAARAGGGDLAGLVHGLLRASWAEERNIAEDEVIRDCLSAAGFDPGLADSGLLAGAETYARNTDEAVAAGVFGAPFYVLDDGERFWGQDRIDDLDAHLGGKL